MAQSDIPASPRLRVEKNTTLNLSTTWPRLDFGDANPLNVNNFPMMSNGTTPYVTWDTTSKLFKFGASEVRNYPLELDLSLTNSSPLTTLLGVVLIRVQYRFVIPSGRGAGLDYYFPYPGTDGAAGYGECASTVSLNLVLRPEVKRIIYTSDNLRANGLGIDVRLSTAPVLGTIALNLATCFIYGR